ncbi:MAG: LptF/LptG family permease [Elusimicrobia bacterium]|nr:LptF/LptG family permease [Elusimicrobiota bacterium]
MSRALGQIFLWRYSALYDKVLLRALAVQFALWLFLFTVIFLLSLFLDKLDIFLNHQASPAMIAAYIKIQLPFWIWKAAPLAFLGASLAVLGDAQKNGELTAMESLGISPGRIYLPVFTAAAILSLAGALGIEARSPLYYRKAKVYLRSEIQKKDKPQGLINNFVAKGREGRYFAFGVLDTQQGSFQDFWLDEWEGQNHHREVFAKKGRYDAKRALWVLEEVTERRYLRGGDEFAPMGVAARIVPRMLLEVPEEPKDLLPALLKVDEMTLDEIVDNINVSRERGIAHRNLVTDYYNRIAWPVVFIVMAILGTTVMGILPKTLFKGKLVLFGITIVIGLAYWFSVSLSRTLSNHGLIEARWAAWGPHAAFVALAQVARLVKFL